MQIIKKNYHSRFIKNPFNPVITTKENQKERQADLCEFKSSLIYRLSTRTAMAMQRNPALKTWGVCWPANLAKHTHAHAQYPLTNVSECGQAIISHCSSKIANRSTTWAILKELNMELSDRLRITVLTYKNKNIPI